MDFFKTFFAGLVFLLLTSALLDAKFLLHGKFKLTFLDIGQGDSILLRTPTNCSILIDGGPPTNLSQTIKNQLPILDKSIDLVVVTHPHLDHFAGILDLQHRYNYKNFWLTGIDYPLPEYSQLLTNLNSPVSKTKLNYITQTKSFYLCGVTIHILMPLESQIGKTNPNINNTSIALLLQFADQSIFLSGDAETEQELELVAAFGGNLPKVNIFKAGHHGSKTSSSIELLEIIKPETMVISCGIDNSYGHPHFETLKKADQLGINVLRTDQLGDINLFF
jgi:competence protein ComEC